MRPIVTLLGLALLAAPAPGGGADDRWLEVRSEHFRLYTNASEKHGRLEAASFEQLRRLLQALGELKTDAAAPVVIVAARDQETMRAYMPAFWERRGGIHPAGTFMSQVDQNTIVLNLGVAADHRDDTAHHEYVHLVVRLNFSGVPLWLDEGLADFYARITVTGGTVQYGRVRPHRLKALRRVTPLPLAALFAIDTGSPEYNEPRRMSLLYGEAALLTHYLMMADGGAHRAALAGYLRQRTEGVPDTEALKNFGDLAALEKAFFEYIRRPTLATAELPLDAAASAITVRPMAEAEVLALRGNVLARVSREADARPLLSRARTLDPNLAPAAFALGLLEVRTGLRDRGLAALADAMRLAPDDFAAPFLWAHETAAPEAGAQALEEAEGMARRSSRLNPAFAPAHVLLADILRRRGQGAAALAALDEAGRLQPHDLGTLARRADLVRELGRSGEADALDARLDGAAANNLEQLRALGAYYRARHRPDDFERLLRSATTLNPRSAQAWTLLGRHLSEQRRLEEAEASFRAALGLQPRNPWALNRVAFVCAERGERLPEALELVGRALEMVPDDVSLLDTRGVVSLKMGRLDAAEKDLRRALERSDDADIIAHLGDLLERRGQKAAAEDTWRRALVQADASDELKEELRRKLGQARE